VTTGDGRGQQDLLSIGRFSRATGLSIGALRHYDAVDLLRPARTDGATGYRSYRVEQVADGRLVVTLKALDLPLEEIRAVLRSDDPHQRQELLRDHRARLQSRLVRLQRMLHQLMHLTGDTPDHPADPTVKEPGMSTLTDTTLDEETQRSLAKRLFNRVWELLELPRRSPDEDDEMVNAAHASRYHWGRVGGAKERAIGEWQISRVYATLGRGEPAVHHARRCHDVVAAQGEQLEPWLAGSAYEALARAYATAGDRAVAREWRDKAVAQLQLVDDPDDREVVEQDIASLPPLG
jgi:DNA-binding transcriptional MerR regulator